MYGVVAAPVTNASPRGWEQEGLSIASRTRCSSRLAVGPLPWQNSLPLPFSQPSGCTISTSVFLHERTGRERGDVAGAAFGLVPGPGRGDRTPSRARVGFGSAFVLPAAVRQRAPGCGGERRPQLPLSAVLACRGSAAAGGSGGSAGVRLLARQFSNVAWSASETSQMTAGGGLHLLWPGAEATSSALLRMYCDSIR